MTSLGLASRSGGVVLAVVMTLTALASFVAPHGQGEQFSDRAFAPPMRIHLFDASGVRAPFVYRQVIAGDRVNRIFHEDTTTPVPLRWFSNGHLVSIDPDAGPLLLLGADPVGRDVFSRLLFGAQLSLGVTAIGLAGALLIGSLVGGLAGSLGGRIDTALMLLSDIVIVLPGTYLVLTLRGLLPMELTTGEVFGWMSLLFSVSAWPHVARGVRAIVATERRHDYAEAARAAGARPLRLLRHLLPAARGFLFVEVLVLVPALLVAEVTVSLLGLGFPDPLASWGTMLSDAQNARVMREAPWTLAPAIAIFLVVLAVHMTRGARSERDLLRTMSTAPESSR